MRKQFHCPNLSLCIISICKLQSDTCETDGKLEQDGIQELELKLSQNRNEAQAMIQPVAMQKYRQPITFPLMLRVLSVRV